MYRESGSCTKHVAPRMTLLIDARGCQQGTLGERVRERKRTASAAMQAQSARAAPGRPTAKRRRPLARLRSCHTAWAPPLDTASYMLHKEITICISLLHPGRISHTTAARMC